LTPQIGNIPLPSLPLSTKTTYLPNLKSRPQAPPRHNATMVVSAKIQVCSLILALGLPKLPNV
jgi:hypothetical protein